MLKLKIGLMVASVVAMFVISATPAFAMFEAEKQLQGTVPNSEILKGGEFVYSGANTVKCPTTSPTIHWYLQKTPSTSQQYKIDWGTGCKALIGGNEVAATISPSQLEVKSPESGHTSYTELLGTNKNATEIKAASCVIKVPFGEGINKELKKTEQTNLTGFEELVKVNTTGIKAEKTKEPLCTLTASTTTAELKGVEFKLKGQKQS